MTRKRKKSGDDILLYKVIELSAVDEHSIEDALNEWIPKGWAFESVQFAMRESSKRPSMAFVFFTRLGTAIEPLSLAPPAPVVNAFERLQKLAEGGDEP